MLGYSQPALPLQKWLLLTIFASLALLACATLTNLVPGDELPPDEAGTEESAPTAADQEDIEVPLIDCPPGGKEENLLLLFPDMLEMSLLTEVSGGGERPLLAWEPVEEAEYYGLVLYDSIGESYWAWIGYETAIYVAGTVEKPPANSEGPIVAECMSWTATAYDVDGIPIAAGGPRTLSP